jgi:hypothetical protein
MSSVRPLTKHEIEYIEMINKLTKGGNLGAIWWWAASWVPFDSAIKAKALDEAWKALDDEAWKAWAQ